MSHFILLFTRDRRAGTETIVERIEDSEAALARLFEIETELRDRPEQGVVMLVAEDEETVRATHSQYFKSLDQLLEVVDA
jgi:hypothetical protein